MGKNQKRAGILLAYGYILINAIIGLFMSAYLLRSLGATNYGVYQTIASFANYLVLLNFGIGTVMTRNLSRALSQECFEIEKKNVATVSIITLVLTVLIITAIAFFYQLLDIIYHSALTTEQLATAKPLFLIVCINIIVTLWSQMADGIIQSHEKFIFSKSLVLAKLLLRTVALIVLIYFIPKAIVVVSVDLCLNVLCTLISYFCCMRWYRFTDFFNVKFFNRAIFKDSLPFALALFLQTVVNQANGNVDQFCIGIMINPESVALYSISLYVYSMYSTIASAPISIYLPQTVKEISRGATKKEITDILIPPSRLLVAASGAVFFCFIAMGRPFIQLVYGGEYLKAWLIAIIIMIPMFINMANGMLVNVLDATGKRMVRSLILMGSTVINIILTVIWIRWIGMIGAALATAVATIVGQIIIMNIYYQKVTKIPVVYMFRKVLHGILLSLIISSICTGIMVVLMPVSIWTFLLEGLFFFTLLCVQLMLYGLSAPEKIVVKNVCSKFYRRVKR